MSLTNLLLVTIDTLSWFIGMVVVAYIVKHFVNKYTEYTLKYNIGYILLIGIVMVIFKVTTSPITRPVNDVHDKVNEVRLLKKEDEGVIDIPKLKDSRPEREYEDISGTPFVDDMLNKEK